MISSADLRNITALIFDIDGTLTDGKVSWDRDGNVIKSFNMRDMHWLKLALRAGLKVGVLSGRGDQANCQLVSELNLSFAVMDAKDKVAGFEQLLQENKLTAAECLYLGDDVVDMPVIRRAGIGAAVADAMPELDEVTQWRTAAPGGQGAAAEVVREVLKAKDLYNLIMERYRR